MHDSKLIQVLKTLTNKDIRKFNDFVRSPFFQKNEDIIRLFECIHPEHPKYESKKIYRHDVFSFLFPKEKFNEQKLRYLMTDLVKLLEDFIGYLSYEEQSLLQKMHLLNALSIRRLDKYFISTMDQARSLQKKTVFRDGDFFYNEHLLDVKAHYYHVGQLRRKNDTSLQHSVENLDRFYLATKLRYCCELMNRKNVFADDYEILFLDEIRGHLNDNSYEDYPVISIYYRILMTIVESEEEEHFNILKDLLNEHSGKFSKVEAQEMYAFAQNYCIKKINNSNLNYLSELFIMYKTLLQKELIYLDGYLSPWHFKNIVFVGLRLDEPEWTEDFIFKYKDKIEPKFRENAYNYNLASLNFYKKNYGRALKTLQKVDFTNVYYHLDSKSLLLKTYYELEETEPLLSLIDAFRIFLRRNKLISDHHRTIYLNQVKFVKKMLGIKIRAGKSKKIHELKEEVESTKQIADMKWLREKIDQLEVSVA